MQLFPPLPGLFRRFQRYGDGEVVPRPRPDLAHPVQQAQAAALGVRDAGDEQLPLRHDAPRRGDRLAVERLHARDKPLAPRNDVADLRLLHHRGRALALHHLHMRDAAADVDREPRHVRQLQQRAVAHVLLMDLQPLRADGHAALLQRAEDRLRRHRLVPRDLKRPDEEVPAEEQQCKQRQRRQQRIARPQAQQQLRRAALAQTAGLRVRARADLPQRAPAPARHAQTQRNRREPLQIPEGNLLHGAQVQHPLRAGALDLHLHAAAQEIQHIPIQHHPTSSTRSTAPPMRSSSSVIASSCRRLPTTRTRMLPPLISISSVLYDSTPLWPSI